VDANKKCNSGDDTVISMPWFGIVHMCNVYVTLIIGRGATCYSQKLTSSSDDIEYSYTNF
jgi:hypothetical protein